MPSFTIFAHDFLIGVIFKQIRNTDELCRGEVEFRWHMWRWGRYVCVCWCAVVFWSHFVIAERLFGEISYFDILGLHKTTVLRGALEISHPINTV